MTKIKVAFQGELGAYSHISVNEIFKELATSLKAQSKYAPSESN